MLLLNVPLSDKKTVKKLGAKWNKKIEKWYVDDYRKYGKFYLWYTPSNADIFITDEYYLVEQKYTCYKCHNRTTILSFAYCHHYYLEDYDDPWFSTVTYCDSIFPIGNFKIPLNKAQRCYLREKFNYYHDDISYLKYSNGCNHCNFCNARQADTYLYNDNFRDYHYSEIADTLPKDVILYRVPIRYDIPIETPDSLLLYNKPQKIYFAHEYRYNVYNFSKFNFIT